MVEAGEPLSWVVLAGVGALAAWTFRLRWRRDSEIRTAAAALTLSILAACFAARWDTNRDWLAYHILSVGWAVTGLLVLAHSAASRLSEPEASATGTSATRQAWCIIVPGVLVLALAGRSVFGRRQATAGPR